MSTDTAESRAASVIPRIVLIVLVLLAISPLLKISGVISPIRSLDDWEKFTGILENIATVIALGLGGIWTYYLFIKKRELAPHLEPEVTGRIITVDKSRFLIATVQVKNTGASKVDIAKMATGLFLDSYENGATKIIEMEWNEVDAVRVLTKEHHWIEPGEVVVEPVLFPLPPDSLNAFFKLRFKINSPEQTWITSAIIDPISAETSSTETDKESGDKPGGITNGKPEGSNKK